MSCGTDVSHKTDAHNVDDNEAINSSKFSAFCYRTATAHISYEHIFAVYWLKRCYSHVVCPLTCIISRDLKHKYRSQFDLFVTWPTFFLTCHSLRFVPLAHFVSTVKSHLHFRRFNIILTHKFHSVSFLKPLVIDVLCLSIPFDTPKYPAITSNRF